MRLAPLLVALPLVLVGCSSDDSASPSPSTLPTVGQPLCSIGPDVTELPEECAPQTGPTGPPDIPTSGYPKSSAGIDPVTIPGSPGDLVAGGNDKDPSLQTRTFTATVPKGQRLQITAACEGATFLEVTTVPTSLAEMEISCFDEGGISELTVGDDKFQKAPQSFQVIVKTKAPSRWFVVVSGTAEALPPIDG